MKHVFLKMICSVFIRALAYLRKYVCKSVDGYEQIQKTSTDVVNVLDDLASAKEDRDIREYYKTKK